MKLWQKIVIMVMLFGLVQLLTNSFELGIFYLQFVYFIAALVLFRIPVGWAFATGAALSLFLNGLYAMGMTQFVDQPHFLRGERMATLRMNTHLPPAQKKEGKPVHDAWASRRCRSKRCGFL